MARSCIRLTYAYSNDVDGSFVYEDDFGVNDCGVDGSYGNRRHVTPGDSDISLDSVCWSSCTSCPVDLCADVTCTASGPCYVAGTCDSSTGTCSTETLAAVDSVCDDGDSTTTNDVCDGQGSCSGVPVVLGCLDSNATNYDSAANTQSVDENGTTSCVYASCATIPDGNLSVDGIQGCLWDTGQSAMWWEGPWNCVDNGGTVCGQHEVKFELDLPDDVSGTPHVQGTLNNWCGSCGNDMSDSDGDGIWTKSFWFDAPGDYYEYKYSIGNWVSQEDLTGLTDCAVNNDTATTYWNRDFTTGDIDTSQTLSSCWGTCESTCSDPNPTLSSLLAHTITIPSFK